MFLAAIKQQAIIWGVRCSYSSSWDNIYAVKVQQLYFRIHVDHDHVIMSSSQGSQILLQNLLKMAENRENTLEYNLEQYCVLVRQQSEIPQGSNVSISICVHFFVWNYKLFI